MARDHPHAGAVYRIVPQQDMTFGVEIIVPGSYPATITSFSSEDKAEAWITDHKRRVDENIMYRSSRTGIARKQVRQTPAPAEAGKT